MLTNLFTSIVNKLKKKEVVDSYCGYYLFGRYANKPIWDWEHWKECLPLLQPIIDLSPNIPSITSSQAVPIPHLNDSKTVSYNKGSLRFGRMLYNDTNNEKWTTQYVHEPNHTFFDTEIVFPTFAHCEKTKTNPDLLIKVTNENLTGSAQTNINQSLIILFKTHLTDPNKLKTIEENIEALGNKLNVVLYGKIIRPAIYPGEYGTYTDYIRDGSRGVYDDDTIDFSNRFKQYGMVTIKRKPIV